MFGTVTLPETNIAIIAPTSRPLEKVPPPPPPQQQQQLPQRFYWWYFHKLNVAKVLAREHILPCDGCLLAGSWYCPSIPRQPIFLELSVWMVCFGGRKFIVLADSISKWIWSWANYYNSKTWMKGILFDLLLWCLERVPKLFSQMVVWWWIVTLQSVKKSPTKHIPRFPTTKTKTSYTPEVVSTASLNLES